MAVMEEMSAVWQEVDHPSGATFEEFFDVQVSQSASQSGVSCASLCLWCCCCCCKGRPGKAETETETKEHCAVHHRASQESQPLRVYVSLVRLACHHPPLGRYFFFSALPSTE